MTLSDLNPDALAELEAKLTRDLEMVRRVRDLLLEHQSAHPSPPATPPPPVAQATPPLPASPPVPIRPINEILLEALPTMPEEGFFIEDLKRACKTPGRNLPDSDTVKAFLRQGVRKGLVIVADIRSGRRGSLYKHTLPRPTPPESPSIPHQLT